MTINQNMMERIRQNFLALLSFHQYNEIKHFEVMFEVHDYLAEILTDRLDEVIDFPIDRRIYNYDEYVNKFFNVIIDNINEIEKIVKEWSKNQ